MSTYTTREVKDIMVIQDMWAAYEHDRWRLVSFSTKEARFGWLESNNLQYTKFVSITIGQVEFITGVPPDVLDSFYA